MRTASFFQKSYPRLDWIQVEVTSICNAHCIYCPHSAYRQSWQNRHLSLSSFQKLTPAFSKTDLIYLQGWGEPFAHPDFMKMLAVAKDAGCRVGTTSNATLLNSATIEKMVAADLDVIGFSLAGIDKKNDRIRKGTAIDNVLRCIDTVHRLKKQLRKRRPMIHVAYMLLRSGLPTLERLPAFLADIGVDQAVISSLSLVVSRDLETEALLATEMSEYRQLKKRLQEVKATAVKKGVDVHFHIASPFQNDGHCSENIQRAMVVGSDGSVSPCVFAQMPATGPNYFFHNGQKRPQQNLSFGNITAKPLNQIWHNKGYRHFRRAHFTEDKPGICQYCWKAKIDDTL